MDNEEYVQEEDRYDTVPTLYNKSTAEITGIPAVRWKDRADLVKLKRNYFISIIFCASRWSPNSTTAM